MRTTIIAPLCAVLIALAACGTSGSEQRNPDLSPRGTALTKAKPTRQTLTTTLALNGNVTMNPSFGLVAPVAGQVRFAEPPTAEDTPAKPARVATVWADGTPHQVEIPAGAVFAGRLVEDRSTVTAGMPIVSAKHAGYGIVADVAGTQAYRISGALSDVRAQIKNGPGPFPCAVLGTIAALPAGTVPETPPPSGEPPAPTQQERSESTGLRIVCTAPDDVTLINGATASVELVTGKSDNALVVPVEAVAGTQGKGKVDVLKPDGSRRTTEVELGITDGKVVEVKSGLTGDEELAVPGPNLAEPAPGGAHTTTGPGR